MAPVDNFRRRQTRHHDHHHYYDNDLDDHHHLCDVDHHCRTLSRPNFDEWGDFKKSVSCQPPLCGDAFMHLPKLFHPPRSSSFSTLQNIFEWNNPRMINFLN